MRGWRLSILVVWLVTVSGLPLHGVMAQATPAADDACQFSLDDPLARLPDACLATNPWWEAYPDCPVTPINPAPWPVREDLDFLPWFDVSMGEVTATALIWYGPRPLPVGTEYPDGTSTKVLWRFSERVLDFTITGTSQDDSALVNVPAAQTNSMYQMGPKQGASQEWPSYVIASGVGCWTFTLHVKTLDGEPLTGQFVSVAAE